MISNIDPKQYTKQVIRGGNKKRIQKVLKRYWSHVRSQRQEDIISAAERIFNDK